jgi:hypothetical protein
MGRKGGSRIAAAAFMEEDKCRFLNISGATI